MKEFLLVFGVLFGIFAAVVALACGGVYWGASAQCNSIHRLTGLDTDASISTGCLVKYEGRWVDADVVTGKKQEVTVKETK